MSYKVTHIERYVPHEIENEYENLDKFIERYNYAYGYIRPDIEALEVGHTIEVEYDPWISLIVTRTED